LAEIHLFGGPSGIGESILIKIDEENYGIIDSFINKSTDNPKVLDFLLENSIDLFYVKFIVLTHCHKDHFTGIRILLENCTNAEFFTSKAIGIKSFQMLISAYCKKVNSRNNYFTEIVEAFKLIKSKNKKVKMLQSGSKPIYEDSKISIQAFSPNKDTLEYLTPLYQNEVHRFLNSNGIRLLTTGFNYQSVVIILKMDNHRILLGADLEYHKTKTKIGWKVLESLSEFDTEFDIFKVPHHGSENGYRKEFWNRILKKNSVLSLTPYSRSKLPRQQMINKLTGHSKAFLTTNPTHNQYKKLPSRIRKKIKDVDLKRIANVPGGHIHNYLGDNGDYETDLFEGAVEL